MAYRYTCPLTMYNALKLQNCNVCRVIFRYILLRCISDVDAAFCVFCCLVLVSIAVMKTCFLLLSTRFCCSHEVVNVNLKMKPEWFFERHPFGLVPILELNDDVVCESSVCNDYLEEVYPAHALYPRDVRERTRQKMIMSMSDRVSSSNVQLSLLLVLMINFLVSNCGDLYGIGFPKQQRYLYETRTALVL